MVRIKQSACGVQIGARYGKWEVLGQPFSIGRKRWMAVVKCECGLIKPVDCVSLAWGESTACRRCGMLGKNTTHGDASPAKRHRLHQIWGGMIQRCTNPKHPAWKDYGGRGITVCEKWLHSYEAFRDWANSNGYADDKQLDRHPDNNSGYSPSNCRWVSCQTNQRNRRDNLMIEAFGESKCLAEWLSDHRCKVSGGALRWRIARGWEPVRAITTPSRLK